MATNNLQSYELMVIFTPVLADDDYKTAQKKFEEIITSNGGEIVHTNPWGLRPLAYPIQKKTTGMYWVLEFSATGETIAKLELQMNRDENVMRHMVTRLDKHAVEYNTRRRNRASNPAQESSANGKSESPFTVS